MYEREGVDALPACLAENYAITVAKLTELDVGVFRVDRSPKQAPLVARLFSQLRPYALAEGDLAALRYLEAVGFPAERPFGDAPLSSHAGQALLLTEFIREVPKPKRPPHPIVRLGAMVGRLHGLAIPAGADRPAGALHHFAEGTMSDELRAVGQWLDCIEHRLPVGTGDAVDALRTAAAAADGGDGLPEAFVHPDPVPKNVIFTADGPILVDWTSAGRGPRLASLTLVLKSGWAAVPFIKGYARWTSLTDAERDRLAGLLFSRRLIDVIFGVCRNPDTAAQKARMLSALRADCEAKARIILDASIATGRQRSDNSSRST
jgi:Ser/Thr protein kinase RdoA (MazF antagonist)